MAQKIKLIGFKLDGAAFTGFDADGSPSFAQSGIATAQWLADTSRLRFNQRRSTRQRYSYRDGERAVDADGSAVLVPIGKVATDLSNKEARQEFPFMAAVPEEVLHYQVRQEDTEWWSAVKRRATLMASGRKAGAMPTFRSRKRSDQTFGVYSRQAQSAPKVAIHRTGRRSAVITFGGRNPVGMRAAGHTRSWTLTVRVRLTPKFELTPFTSMQVNLTSRTVILTSPVPTRVRDMTGAVIGIDMGNTVHIATSDGHLLNPPPTNHLLVTRKKAQRKMARSRRAAIAAGRNFWEVSAYQQAKKRAARATTRQNNILTQWRHQTTHDLVRDYDQIFIERLAVSNLNRSAKGTIDRPGTHVAQKRGLNRGLAHAAPATIAGMLAYKTIASGSDLTRVNPKHTSQRCNQCGHIAPENRESQAVFRCVNCGHAANADTNAALNILERGLGTWVGTHAQRGRRQKTDMPLGMPAGIDTTPKSTPAVNAA